jgi:hypothetical protein
MATRPGAHAIIALLTDFGTRDESVACLKPNPLEPMKLTAAGKFSELWFLNGNNFTFFLNM